MDLKESSTSLSDISSCMAEGGGEAEGEKKQELEKEKKEKMKTSLGHQVLGLHLRVQLRLHLVVHFTADTDTPRSDEVTEPQWWPCCRTLTRPHSASP